MNKKILSFITLSALAVPLVIFAKVPPIIEDILGNAVDLAVNVGISIVVIAWVVTGVLFLAAQGEPGRLSKARTALLASIAGTVFIIIARIAINIIKDSFGL